MRSIKKTIAVILCVLIAAGSMVFAEEVQLISAKVKDYEGHWAQATIEKWMNEGKVSGYPDGSYKPDNNVTRAEFVKMVNGIIDFNKKANLAFKDVPATEWYHEYISIAQEIGYISGYSAEKFGPNDYITREQAASILSRIQYLDNNNKGLDKFSDKDSISTWATGTVGAASEAGFISGYEDGSFKPLKNLSRAEALTMIDNVLVNGKNVVVYNDKVQLSNTQIKGDLIIAKTVGEGDVYLSNLGIEGQVKVYGGGMNSVYFNNVKIAKVIVEKDKVRLVFDEGSKVEDVIISSQAELVNTDGSIAKVTVTGDKSVTLSGNYDDITISSKANIILDDAKITKLTIEQPIVIQGTGTIATLQANANGITYEADVKIDKTTVGTGVIVKPTVIIDAPGGGGPIGPIEENVKIIVTITPPDGSPMALNTSEYTNEDTIYEALTGILNDDVYAPYITGKLDAYVTKLNGMQVDGVTGISAIWDKSASYLPVGVQPTINSHKSMFDDEKVTIPELNGLLNAINGLSDSVINEIIAKLEADKENIDNFVFMYNGSEVTYSISVTGSAVIQQKNTEIAKLVLTDVLKANIKIGDFFEKYGKLTITSSTDTAKTASISIEMK